MIRILLTTLALLYSCYLGWLAAYLHRKGKDARNRQGWTSRFMNYFQVSVPVFAGLCLLFSLAWSVASVLLAISAPIAQDWSIFCAVISIWFFPFGSILSVLILILFYAFRQTLAV
ncbi:MAG: hypothetical protein AAFV80_16225 [Bacteroidota bacterium]